MKAFFTYFFGSGNQVEFSLFTVAHLAPILWMLVMIYLIYRNADKLRGFSKEEMTIHGFRAMFSTILRLRTH